MSNPEPAAPARSLRLRGRHFETSQLLDVVVANGTITSVGPAGALRPDHEAGWIGPGLFDLQVNGCAGYSFNSDQLTFAQIAHVVAVCREHGVTQLCPTLVTGSFAAIAHGLTTLRQACEQDAGLNRAIVGIHVEGPYISPEDGPRGAHPRRHVRHPDWDEFCRWQDAAGGRIRLMTLAPEVPGAIGFLEKLVASGVVVALGHTAAQREDIQAAIAAGARLSTHLGNGSHAVLPRHDNYLWEQLAADELWASIICDGHHLPPTLVKCFLRIKTPARVILTCDAGPLAGMPPGRYREWDQDFEITPAHKIIVPGTSFLAGSWAFTDHCVSNVLRFTDLTLAAAIHLASTQPRDLLRVPPPTLAAGQPANLILFDWQPGGEIQVKKVI